MVKFYAFVKCRVQQSLEKLLYHGLCSICFAYFPNALLIRALPSSRSCAACSSDTKLSA